MPQFSLQGTRRFETGHVYSLTLRIQTFLGRLTKRNGMEKQKQNNERNTKNNTERGEWRTELKYAANSKPPHLVL